MSGAVPEVLWMEKGGPLIGVRNKRGFGSLAIQRNLARSLDSEVELQFANGGVIAVFAFRKCTSFFRLRLSRFLRPARAGVMEPKRHNWVIHLTNCGEPRCSDSLP